MTTGNDGAIQVYGVAMRLTALNADGSFSPGNNLYVSDQLMQLVCTPNVQSGDDLTQLNAAGDLCGVFHHGDMIKRYDLTLSICAPDPELEQMLVGGQVLTDNAVALTAPTAPTATPSASGGTLASGTDYSYKVSAVGRYGETTATAQASPSTVTGATGSVALSWAAVTGAVGYRIYGRHTGQSFLIAQVGTVLTYTDTGTAFIGQGPPTANGSAGPGTVGMAAPALRKVGNPNGDSLEVWARAIIGGNPASSGGGPFLRWVLPWTKNWRNDARTFDNTIFTNQFVGEATENINWGSGPRADWPLTSTQVMQRARESSFPTPSIGVQAV